MDPMRLELDLPVVVITHYGSLQLDNLKKLEDTIVDFFRKGSVLSIHMIVEDTGDTRQFCDFLKDRNGTYPHNCNLTMSSSGVCPNESEHAKERERQLTLEEAE